MVIQRKRKKTRWEPEEQFLKRKRQRQYVLTPGRGPLLTKQLVNFRYQENGSLNPTALGTAVQVFSANGVYDPNITGVGHQPRGFDELMLLYDHAVVIACKVTIDFYAKASETVNTLCGVAVRDFTTTDNDNGYIEGGHCLYKIVPFGTGYQSRIVMNVNPNKFLGRASPMSDPNLKNSSSSNPTEQAYFHVFVAGPDSSDPGAYNFSILLEYTTVLLEPKVPTQS